MDGGRALYDNLMKYIRFQIVSLTGFIASSSAGIFNIADGIPAAADPVDQLRHRRPARGRSRLRRTDPD